MIALAAATGEEAWLQALLAVLGVVQTIALAVIADRSRRVRSTDARQYVNEARGGPVRDPGDVPDQRRPPAGEAPAAGQD